MTFTLPPLPRFPKTAYGPKAARLQGVKRTLANVRGWGSGWPNCQPSKLGQISANRINGGRFRTELVPLAEYLIKASNALGYDIRKTAEVDGGVGTFSCRAIKHSSPPVPSNHSWGLAIDQNTKSNPMSKTFHSTTPPEIVDLWESSGFYWGGRYPVPPWFYDCMHFEYLGKPSDVATDLANAKAAFGRLNGSDILYPTLALAGTGPAAMIRVLQYRLNEHGAALEENGAFDVLVDTAVRAFQKECELVVDGIVGPITWGVLNQDSFSDAEFDELGPEP